MIKKLIDLLPVSRKTFKQLLVAVEGLIEADANHCQVEANLIQHLQIQTQPQTQMQKQENIKAKSTSKKGGSDPAFQ